jgi:hypothetical protein
METDISFMHRRLGAVKNRNMLPTPEIEPRTVGHPARSLVTVPVPVYATTEISPLPALQPCMDLEVLHGFITVNFYWVGFLAT